MSGPWLAISHEIRLQYQTWLKVRTVRCLMMSASQRISEAHALLRAIRNQGLRVCLEDASCLEGGCDDPQRFNISLSGAQR